MKPIIEVPRNAFVAAATEQNGLLIDARDYYRSLYRALERAQSYALISGWQFESGLRLLRGQDEQATTRPVKLLEFLSALCEERPNLTVYLLAWDFSLVCASDRESKQREKFTAGHPRIRFEWDTHPAIAASHHQKFAVVDGAVAFLGGIDLCDARWDDCSHLAKHPDRVNVVGDPCKPYHDVQACVTGPLVSSLVEVFVERWGRACDEALHLPPAPGTRFDLGELSAGSAVPIATSRAALSRTQADDRAEPALHGEILNVFADAIARAEQLIYIETQYFTSRTLAKLLIARLEDQTLPKLQIVVFLPHGADSAMEKMALEDTQEGVLRETLAVALATGHDMRLFYPASENGDGSEIATFIHSKILLVDDRLLLVGSPNFTERSMALDTEIAITWECQSEDDPLRGSIRAIRAQLLAEHSGVSSNELESPEGLCARLDGLLARGTTRLRLREVHEPGLIGSLLAPVFDPGEDELATAVLAGSDRA